MNRLVNVQTCTLRRDDKYLVTYRVGSVVHTAISDKPVPIGADVRVRDGKVDA